METYLALNHARPGEVIRLTSEDDSDFRTHAIVRTTSFEAIRLGVPAGTSIPTHHVAGHIILQGLSGRAKLQTSTLSVELLAGDWLYLEPGEPHSVHGLEDAELLLTIMFNVEPE